MRHLARRANTSEAYCGRMVKKDPGHSLMIGTFATVDCEKCLTALYEEAEKVREAATKTCNAIQARLITLSDHGSDEGVEEDDGAAD